MSAWRIVRDTVTVNRRPFGVHSSGFHSCRSSLLTFKRSRAGARCGGVNAPSSCGPAAGGLGFEVGFETEGEADFRPAVFARRRPDVAPLRFNQALADRQADTGAGGFVGRAARAVEGREDTLSLFGLDAAPAVKHANGDPAVVVGGSDLDRPPSWAVLLGVVQ